MAEELKEYEFIVSEESEGERVDKYLTMLMDSLSRSYLQKLLKESHVTVGGQPVKANYRIKTEDAVRVLLPPLITPDILPENIPLDVLYEDEDILVVNKSADVPVHPSIGNYTNTLANGVAAYFQSRGLNCPFRCINRLDRDTSGGIILAKNALSAAVLSDEMRSRKIRRTYLAIVEGIIPENGTISAPIGRKEGSVMERHIDFEHGETAITHYERLAVINGFSLAELHLETGRTHQIRVHMGYIGHPLPADYLYNPVYDHFKRQPLHSFQLDFTHPLTGKEMCITAPVPDDLYDFCRK